MSHGENGFGEWGGYMNAKMTKLEDQLEQVRDVVKESDLFAGISIYVNGLTVPSADDLKNIMMQHGGTFHIYERSYTTYIIASNLPDVKVRNAKTQKIISADWVVDCVRERRLLDYTRYLLYTNRKTTQPRITFQRFTKEENCGPKPKQEKKNDDDDGGDGLNVASIMAELKLLNEKVKKENEGSTPQVVEKPVPKTDNNPDIDCPMTEMMETDSNEPKEQPQAQPEPEAVAVAVAPNDTNSLSEEPKPSTSAAAGSNHVARTAVDPLFLIEFYNNSRLHHISTLSSGYKQLICDLRLEHKPSIGFPARKQLRERLLAAGCKGQEVSLRSIIMHIDMDCFFVSVGLRKHPHLIGQPVAVTHSKGGANAVDVPVHPNSDRQAESELFVKRFEHHLHDNVRADKVRKGFEANTSLSEIASCSYEARQRGVRNGMFVGQALQLCPQLKTIPYDFDGYKEVSQALYDTITQYTLNIEAVSCDEMFVDLTELLDDLEVKAMDLVGVLRAEVRERAGCPVSAGVGVNKLQARLATKRAKPDGQFHLLDTDVEAYMADIPISDLPGVGSCTSHILEGYHMKTCGDLQRASLSRVQLLAGKKLGETLHQFCRGIDKRPLTYEQIRKSVSAEVNYGIRFENYAQASDFVTRLIIEAHRRLVCIKRRTKCVTLKLMVRATEAPLETAKYMGHGICDNITKSTTLPEFTNDLEMIRRYALNALKALKLPPLDLRGVGVQLSKLDTPGSVKYDNTLQKMFTKVSDKPERTKVKAEVKPTDEPIEPCAPPPPIPPRKKYVTIVDMFKRAAIKKQTTPASAAPARPVPPSSDLTDFLDSMPSTSKAAAERERKLKEAQQQQQQLMEAQEATGNAPLALTTKDLIEGSAVNEKTMAEVIADMDGKIKGGVHSMDIDESEINKEFLRALPPDIRSEVERDIGLQLRNMQLIAESHTIMATDLTMKGPSSPVTPPEDAQTEENILRSENAVELLGIWIRTTEAPSQGDIELLKDCICDLVRSEEIDRVFDILKTAKRLIESLKIGPENAVWPVALEFITDAVQLEIRAYYDQRMLLLPASCTPSTRINAKTETTDAPAAVASAAGAATAAAHSSYSIIKNNKNNGKKVTNRIDDDDDDDDDCDI